ncbi:DUF1501 domain-containing protein [Taibaiella lutea]|nr:DUF1501 domain-containing protein [Taibaiella lutea]
MAQDENATVPKGNKVLVVLQLSGGNDGLNTVIPFSNDIYYKSRPVIGLQKDKMLTLTDEVGIHSELSFFKSLYDEGNLGILNSVGYPVPDRSHFRSMDIWQSASDSNKYLQTGWIGRYLDEQCMDCEMLTTALEFDDTLSMAGRGVSQKALAAKDPARLLNNSKDAFLKSLTKMYQHDLHSIEHESPVDYLYKTMAATQSSASYIFEKSNSKKTTATYPNTQLGKSMKTISSLILSDANTQIYYVSIGSFDTHVDQIGRQAGLFKQINDAIEAFTNDLKANNKFEDVLLFTFSEFGRRVSQNASKGTDHGTANNMFFVGGGLKQKGLLNNMPDLEDLDAGDLKYKVDFKSVYATVLKNWLGADDEKILGKKMEYLSFV